MKGSTLETYETISTNKRQNQITLINFIGNDTYSYVMLFLNNKTVW